MPKKLLLLALSLLGVTHAAITYDTVANQRIIQNGVVTGYTQAKIHSGPAWTTEQANRIASDTVGYVSLTEFRPYTDGVTPSDSAFALANDVANATGKPLLLPPYTIVLRNQYSITKIIGVKGKSVIQLKPTVKNKSLIFNRHFSFHTRNDADNVILSDFTIRYTPDSLRAVNLVSFANVKSADISGMTFIVDSGDIAERSSILEFYSASMNVNIHSNSFYDLGGGTAGCSIHIRNFGSDSINNAIDTVKNIVIRDNYIVHITGDEAIGVYSGNGPMSNILVENNTILTPRNSRRTGQPYIVSLMAGNSCGVNGKFASLTNALFQNNHIEAWSTTASAIKLGYEGCDTLNVIRNVRSVNNSIHFKSDSIASTDLYGVRIMQQTSGVLPYDQIVYSQGDKVYGDADTVSAGFFGGRVIDGYVSGNVDNGTVFGAIVEGGSFEVNAQCHYQPRSVTGGRGKGTYAVWTTSPFRHKLIVRGMTGGSYSDGFVSIISPATMDTIIINDNIVDTITTTGTPINIQGHASLLNVDINYNYIRGANTFGIIGSWTGIRHAGNRYNGIVAPERTVVGPSGAYQILPHDDDIILSGTTVIPLTLPASTYLWEGKRLTIKRKDSNTTAHTVTGGWIDDAATFTFSTAYQSITLEYQGGRWWIVAQK